MRINKNKGTQLEVEGIEKNLHVWTTKDADVFVSSPDNPFRPARGSKPACSDRAGSEFVREIAIIGLPKHVQSIAGYLKTHAERDTKKMLESKQGAPRKNVIKIGHETECTLP
jgi:hypothetical protein